jgi:hypothetical protein
MLRVVPVGMLSLDFTILATNHDLTLIAAFRVASGRINGFVLVVIIPRGPLIATALHVPSSFAIGRNVIDSSVAHCSMWRSVLARIK